MSGEPLVSRRSADVLRRRAGNLNALAFALLAISLLVGAFLAAWWEGLSSGRTAADELAFMMWWVGATTAAASGGLAAAVGGVVLNAIADSQEADRYSTDATE